MTNKQHITQSKELKRALASSNRKDQVRNSDRYQLDELSEMSEIFDINPEKITIDNSAQKMKSKNYSTKIERAVGKKLKCDCSLICLCVITVLSNSAYALIAPFLPTKLAEKNIPLHLFGYLFAIYSVAVMLCSP